MYAIYTPIVAITLTLLNSINYFVGVYRQQPGEVYLGTTHYFEDYFFYLSQFFQGAHGGWLTQNRYSSEPTAASILFWPNVMLGKIGGLFGFDPSVSYNISVLLLSLALLLTLASLMRSVFAHNQTKALAGFILATTATSLLNRIWVNGAWMWYPFEQWKTPNFALDRLGSVPHQTLQTLLFLLAMTALSQKRAIAQCCFLLLLTTLNPVMSAMFLIAAWVASPRIKLVVPSVGFLCIAWYYNALTNAQPHMQSKAWEAADQTLTSPFFMLLSIGPISLLGILGAWIVRKHLRPIHVFSVALLAVSYLLYFSPLPRLAGISNSRVLFPGLWAAWGILAVEAVYYFKKPLIVVLVFLLLTLPTLRWEIQRKLVVKPHERIPLLYIPEDVYQAFAYLKNQRPRDDAVLANAGSHMDAMVPAFSGHTSVTGHPFATIANEDKKRQADRFFTGGMAQEEALRWLTSLSIRYVLITKYDRNPTYPFMTRLFSSPGATVWSVP